MEVNEIGARNGRWNSSAKGASNGAEKTAVIYGASRQWCKW